MRTVHRLRAEERGANLVEFALVLPVLLALVFGMIDFGIGFNEYISVRQGARDAAREASVAEFDGPTCTLATGASGTSTTQDLMCLAKEKVGLGDDTRVKVVVDAGYDVGDEILVCVQHPIGSVTGIYAPLLDGKYVKTEVRMRAEQVDVAFESGEEPVASGGNWTWCA